MAQPPRLATILSFSDHAEPDDVEEGYREEEDEDDDDAASVDSFEFAFARPLVEAGGSGDGGGDVALADDLFEHGRILPAYPVFDRRIVLEDSSPATTAPPSPDTYCAWAPRSAPGSPSRDLFPKSASTGEATRRFRLRDVLAGATNRSHSDGKEKFVFLQPPTTPQRTSALSSTAAAGEQRAKKSAPPPPPPPQAQQQRQGGGKKKGAVTEMDMATAHKLFYSKTGAGGERRQQHATSYLPYRPGIVGFFAAAHALGRSHHHPY